MKVAVLVSGNGTNLQNLIDRQQELGIEIVCVVANKECVALERAKKANIYSIFISHKDKTREVHEIEIVAELEKYDVKLVCLAGYMRLISSYFVNKFKVMNIHPSLLPSFPGTKGYEDAWEYGVKVHGCTVHFVDDGIDTGAIIVQKSYNVNHESFDDFKNEGLKLEYEAYAQAIKIVISDKYNIEGRKVRC
jgi:phosphoribosylglycinamide formyltransferase 1